jgi:Arc/MetJ family transcription regulator
MRTTIDIPDDLIGEAMKLTKYRTKTELIKDALRQIIQRHKIQALKKYRGKVDLDINLNKLRERDADSGR